MFGGQREFRGIAMTSSLLQMDDLLKMIPENRIRDARPHHIEGPNDFDITHGYFLSPTAYASPDLLEDVQVRVGRKVMYKYDIYVCQWKRGRRSSFVCLAPFGRLAHELFGLLDTYSRRFKRQYLQVHLADTIAYLGSPVARSDDLVLTRTNFQVLGGDTAKSATIAGSDVLGSELYRRLVRSVRGLELVPQRLRFRHRAGVTTTACEVDSHGSFWIRLRKDGVNLPGLHSLLVTLDKAQLLSETIAFPLRKGIIEEDEHE